MYWNLFFPHKLSGNSWLTLTWDVLKLLSEVKTLEPACWLTLTWDVLKYNFIFVFNNSFNGLTLTWDVLK